MHRVSRALQYVMGAPALSRAIRSTTRRHGLTPALIGHRMTGLNGAELSSLARQAPRSRIRRSLPLYEPPRARAVRPTAPNC
jgi:hypothetical protein